MHWQQPVDAHGSNNMQVKCDAQEYLPNKALLKVMSLLLSHS